MTRRLMTLISLRMTNPEAARDFPALASAVRNASPNVAVRYERLLQASGALTNPETTPQERTELVEALFEAAPVEEYVANGPTGAELPPAELEPAA